MESVIAKSISFENLRKSVGDFIGVSDWYLVDQPLIDQFAEITRDTNFLHIDPILSASTGAYGGTIAHGFLVLSLISDMANRVLPVCEGMVSAVNYGFNKIRFVDAVPSGKRVRASFTLADTSLRKPNQVMVSYLVDIEIENGVKPAIHAEWLSLINLE